MKVKSICTFSFLLFLIFLFPINTFAQLFGADDEDLAKIEFELKKFNTHLENLKNTQLKNLQGQQEDLLRQIEEIKQILPQLLEAIDQNKQETLSSISRTNAKLADLEAEVKDQVLDKIHQQNKILQLFRAEQANLKEGLAQDMENFEQSSKSNFQDFSAANEKTLGRVVQQLESQNATTKKGFEDTITLFRTDVIPAIAKENQRNRQMVLEHLTNTNKETQKNLETFSAKNYKLNQKLIAILQESLKQGVGTKSLLDSLKKEQGVIHASLKGADEKINKLAESLKDLQAQNTTTSETLGGLKANLEHSGEFNKLADEKFNKLIELTSELAVHSTDLENSVVGQLKDSAQKEEAGNIKIDLANEKLSRLIEILKTIAKEQAKLDPLATTLGTIQKEQGALQKSQAGLMKNQKEIKEALADLRRKANVNISRNDDIKKTLGRLNSVKSGAGGK